MKALTAFVSRLYEKYTRNVLKRVMTFHNWLQTMLQQEAIRQKFASCGEIVSVAGILRGFSDGTVLIGVVFSECFFF